MEMRTRVFSQTAGGRQRTMIEYNIRFDQLFYEISLIIIIIYTIRSVAGAIFVKMGQ